MKHLSILKYLVLLIFTLLISIPSLGQNSFTQNASFSVYQDDIELSGTVKVYAEFVFLGAPYLKVKYSNLKITSARYKNELFNTNSSYGGSSFADEFITFPYEFSSGSNKINVEFPIYLAFQAGTDNDNEYYCRVNINQSERIYFSTNVYGISDVSEVKEAANYFKNRTSKGLSDSEIWECSKIISNTLKINSLSSNIVREIKLKLDQAISNKNKIEREREQQEREKESKENLAKREKTNSKQSSETEDSRNKNDDSERKKSDNQSNEREDEIKDNSDESTNSNPYIRYQNSINYARQAESRGDYQTAIRFYQSAYNMSPTIEVANKIKYLKEMQATAAAIPAMTAAFEGLERLSADPIIEDAKSINIGRHWDENENAKLSLSYSLTHFTRYMRVGFLMGINGVLPSDNIDLYGTVPMGIGIGTNYFGVYLLGGALGGYRIVSKAEIEERFYSTFFWGIDGYIAIKKRPIQFYFHKMPNSNSEVIPDFGIYPSTWNIGVGFVFKQKN